MIEKLPASGFLRGKYKGNVGLFSRSLATIVDKTLDEPLTALSLFPFNPRHKDELLIEAMDQEVFVVKPDITPGWHLCWANDTFGVVPSMCLNVSDEVAPPIKAAAKEEVKEEAAKPKKKKKKKEKDGGKEKVKVLLYWNIFLSFITN